MKKKLEHGVHGGKVDKGEVEGQQAVVITSSFYEMDLEENKSGAKEKEENRYTYREDNEKYTFIQNRN